MKLFAGQHLEGSVNTTAAPVEITAQEREIDRVLADSFPASDSPPWTLGVSHDPARFSEGGCEREVTPTLINIQTHER